MDDESLELLLWLDIDDAVDPLLFDEEESLDCDEALDADDAEDLLEVELLLESASIVVPIVIVWPLTLATVNDCEVKVMIAI